MTLVQMLLPWLYFGVILGVTALAAKLGSVVVGGLMSRSPPQVTAGARRLTAALILLVGAVFAIQEVGVNSNVLILVLFLVGVAMLIALREQLENFGAKYFTDIYSPYKVGDSIRIRDYSGKVIEINATSTVLLTVEDQLVSVPNSTFMREVVVNTSPKAWQEVNVPMSIGTSVDLATFESELLRSMSKLRLRLDRRYPPVLTVKARSALGTDLILTLMIRRPEEREALVAEVSKRVSEVIARATGGRAKSSPVPVPTPPVSAAAPPAKSPPS
ncbi:MAG TPA: mechanosensitive ion channel domain-containing protein [Thermoplasmata archaeon]|nr:mechanosensitive ion channel domain-containing protein [Thermoplasmata archaeon]